MTCPMSNENDPKKDTPANKEIALVWTLHEYLVKLYQFSQLADDNRRKSNFRWAAGILARQLNNYLIKE